MSAQPAEVGGGLELLERALGYTRGRLATVRPGDLCSPTPCDVWRLGDLLAHMEDALDAFAEGAAGAVGLSSSAPTPLPDRLAALQAKACGLLGAWTSARTPVVEVGGRPVPVATISRVAALEIAVHGWDVGQATGYGTPLAEDFAAEMLPIAAIVANAPDARERFAAPVALPPGSDVSSSTRLLALLGRRRYE